MAWKYLSCKKLIIKGSKYLTKVKKYIKDIKKKLTLALCAHNIRFHNSIIY